jgi:hypothetical protein
MSGSPEESTLDSSVPAMSASDAGSDNPTVTDTPTVTPISTTDRPEPASVSPPKSPPSVHSRTTESGPDTSRSSRSTTVTSISQSPATQSLSLRRLQPPPSSTRPNAAESGSDTSITVSSTTQPPVLPDQNPPPHLSAENSGASETWTLDTAMRYDDAASWSSPAVESWPVCTCRGCGPNGTNCIRRVAPNQHRHGVRYCEFCSSDKRCWPGNSPPGSPEAHTLSPGYGLGLPPQELFNQGRHSPTIRLTQLSSTLADESTVDPSSKRRTVDVSHLTDTVSTLVLDSQERLEGTIKQVVADLTRQMSTIAQQSNDLAERTDRRDKHYREVQQVQNEVAGEETARLTRLGRDFQARMDSFETDGPFQPVPSRS